MASPRFWFKKKSEKTKLVHAYRVSLDIGMLLFISGIKEALQQEEESKGVDQRVRACIVKPSPVIFLLSFKLF